MCFIHQSIIWEWSSWQRKKIVFASIWKSKLVTTDQEACCSGFCCVFKCELVRFCSVGCSEVFRVEFNYWIFSSRMLLSRIEYSMQIEWQRMKSYLYEPKKGICIYFGEIFGFDIMVFWCEWVCVGAFFPCLVHAINCWFVASTHTDVHKNSPTDNFHTYLWSIATYRIPNYAHFVWTREKKTISFASCSNSLSTWPNIGHIALFGQKKRNGGR